MKTKVSIIMPFVNEWPQIAFTVRAAHEDLRKIDHEIVVIDNYCQEVENQGNLPDRGHSRYMLDKVCKGFYNVLDDEKEKYKMIKGHMEAQANMHDWLKYVKYDKKLSHWNAKNVGVQASDGDILLFLDAHVIASEGLLNNALNTYSVGGTSRATYHLPLSYHILEEKRLVYKMVCDEEAGVLHYSFMTMPHTPELLLEVPCMSTCGMIMWRKIYDRLGGWPEGMGIYGGGENFINFVCAAGGIKKYIFNGGTLHHHGDRRGYHFNWYDYHCNRMIATICFGGSKWGERYKKSLGVKATTDRMMNEAFACYDEHKDKMKVFDGVVTPIEDWLKEWEDKRAIGAETEKIFG